MLERIPLRFLAETALIGSFGVCLTGYIFNHNVERKVRETKTYKRALKILYDHAPTVEQLGGPISEGRMKFDNDKDLKKFIVNLKGSKAKGKLNCEYIVKPDKQTEITKVEMKFDDIPNKIFVIHEI